MNASFTVSAQVVEIFQGVAKGHPNLSVDHVLDQGKLHAVCQFEND